MINQDRGETMENLFKVWYLKYVRNLPKVLPGHGIPLTQIHTSGDQSP